MDSGYLFIVSICSLSLFFQYLHLLLFSRLTSKYLLFLCYSNSVLVYLYMLIVLLNIYCRILQSTCCWIDASGFARRRIYIHVGLSGCVDLRADEGMLRKLHCR